MDGKSEELFGSQKSVLFSSFFKRRFHKNCDEPSPPPGGRVHVGEEVTHMCTDRLQNLVTKNCTL